MREDVPAWISIRATNMAKWMHRKCNFLLYLKSREERRASADKEFDQWEIVSETSEFERVLDRPHGSLCQTW